MNQAIWLSPIVVVPKKNEKSKICIDFHKLNSTTKKDHYLFPFPKKVLDVIIGHEILLIGEHLFG